MNRTFVPIFAAVAALGMGNVALACGSTGKVVFSDKFDSFSKEWGTEDNIMKLKNGELTFAETEGKSYTVYAGPSFRDVDYCATVKVTESSAVDESYGGIIFWARDIDHYYAFQITVDGYGTVFEYAEEWKSIIDDRAFSAIKKGMGTVNELRVVTKGPNATFYVNDQKFDTINVKTAPGTQHVGFTVDAPNGTAGKASFAFDNAQVRN